MEGKFINEAFVYWSTGNALEAGRLIYEQLPNNQRPLWAAKILNLGRQLIPTVSEIDTVYKIALNRSRWREAHSAFSRVRELTLAFEKSNSQDFIYGGVLYLAENTAKVSYNASENPAPFDYDSGWWIVSNLRFLVEKVGDSDFESKAWSMAGYGEKLEI